MQSETESPESQLAGFLARFSPEIETKATAILARMRQQLPGATQLVYDNYNALAIGFGPSVRSSEAIFSIAVYPRWVSLFFLNGTRLEDPDRILKGTGNKVRHIVLTQPCDLEKPAVIDLMRRAMNAASVPIDPAAGGPLIIRSVAARQRPRRPAGKT